jgi:hypothetical protein
MVSKRRGTAYIVMVIMSPTPFFFPKPTNKQPSNQTKEAK